MKTSNKKKPYGLTEVVDGIEWHYRVRDEKVRIYRGVKKSAIPADTKGCVTVPATLGGYPVTVIGAYAFYNCRSITDIRIPKGVTTFARHAFSECVNLEGITYPGTVMSIDDLACENSGIHF